MNTSYFAKYRGELGVSIAVKSAPGFTGMSYPALFPKWSFIERYKSDGDEEAYVKSYRDEILSNLDPEQVYLDLRGRVLLCWERSGSFCHRRLVAEWLEESLDVWITEL